MSLKLNKSSTTRNYTTTENFDKGKFCRNCGANLRRNSRSLQVEDDSEGMNAWSLLDPTGISSSIGQIDGKNQKEIKTTDDFWADGIKTSIFGFGFLIIAIVLYITGVAQSWWWAMLFPAFCMLAKGISDIVKANRLERSLISKKGISQQSQLPLKETEFVSNISDLKYQTGDLIPRSVVKNTTRNLQIESDKLEKVLPNSET